MPFDGPLPLPDRIRAILGPKNAHLFRAPNPRLETIDKVLLLADHLERNVQDHQFDYFHWETCAGGHACDVPEFRRAGLYRDSFFGGPRYDGAGSAGISLVKFFDMTLEDVSALFASNYPEDQTRMGCVANLRNYAFKLKTQR